MTTYLEKAEIKTNRKFSPGVYILCIYFYYFIFNALHASKTDKSLFYQFSGCSSIRSRNPSPSLHIRLY